MPNQILCTFAGKYMRCQGCKASKPHFEGDFDKCPVANGVYVPATKIIGGTFEYDKFKNENYFETKHGMRIKGKLINKTEKQTWGYDRVGKEVVVWLTTAGIEVLRFIGRK